MSRGLRLLRATLVTARALLRRGARRDEMYVCVCVCVCVVCCRCERARLVVMFGGREAQ
eukprot:COSAG04_NODE_2089_length_4822_cov_39.655939_2_plen_59_part_00